MREVRRYNVYYNFSKMFLIGTFSSQTGGSKLWQTLGKFFHKL